MLRRVIDEGVRRADFLLQSRVCIVQPFFVSDPTADDRGEMYTAEDWSRLRRLHTAPFASEDRYGSDAAYLRYLASIHESKILAVRSLIGAVDFCRYRRIMELGCGDMPQAYSIMTSFPGTAYTATDFDPRVIEDCSRLALLSGIRKFVLDVARDDLEELRNHDLVTSWSLESSLSDAQLIRLFAACSKHSVPYLLCSHATIGPLGYLARERASRRGEDVKGNGMRMLGWLRSVGEITRLAHKSGMSLQWKSYHVNHAALFFAPPGHLPE